MYDVKSCRLVGLSRFPVETCKFEGLAVHRGQIYAHLYEKDTYQLGLYTYDIDEDTWTEVFRKSGHYIDGSTMVIVALWA